ncbi:MAG: hypothetical protein JW774_04040 [Candidatus Aureabacteria bacterium]|nr:hypothetical protein [Candidatus Auribacterota bacterium]
MMISPDRIFINPHEKLLIKVDSCFRAEMQERRKDFLRKSRLVSLLLTLGILFIFSEYKGFTRFSKNIFSNPSSRQTKALKSHFLPCYLNISVQPFLIPCKVSSFPQSSAHVWKSSSLKQSSEESR